ncbi:MAG: porin family protein [Sphingomonas sp.]|uniref:outer membrane protein n=1 Tax=Sphingomonas sp. TaxID=28214 RepID=UPI001AC5EA5B|nr:porin family protein [Sphingomonas sp.]MBN8814452.1 porin family protein [Sphingomonas sp.]
MRLIAASLLLSALATPAFGQNSDKPFDGASITAITGVDNASAFGTSGTGVLYGGQIGYDIQSGKTVFGVEGEVAGASTKYCTSPTATTKFCDKAGRDLYVGGRLGYVVGRSTMVYGKAGYSNGRDSVTYTDSVTPANNSKGAGNQDGWRAGVGVETRISDHLIAKAEYRYTNYANSDYGRNQGVVGLGFRF